MAQYTWAATATGGAWSLAKNWRVNGAQAATPPASGDNATVTGPTGTVFQLLVGPASGATTTLIGNTALVAGPGGNGFSFNLLTLTPTTQTTTTDAVDLESGVALAAAGLTVDSNLEVDGAAAVAGALVQGGSGGEILVVNGGVADATAWTLSSGDLYVDQTGRAEVGTAGGAALGEVTVDAGGTLTLGGGSVEDAVVDNGTIAATATLSAASISGSVSGSGQIQVSANAALSVTGDITGLSAAGLASDASLTAGVVSGVGAINIGSSATFNAASLASDGPVVDDGAATITSTVSGASRFAIGNNASATIDGTLSGLSSLSMGTGASLTLVAGDTNVPITLAGDDTLILDNAASDHAGVNIGGAISGFDSSSLIQHQDFGPATGDYQFITAATYTPGAAAGQGTLVLTADGNTIETLALSGPYAGQQFLVNSAGLSDGFSSYSDITLPFGTTTVTGAGAVTGGRANQFLLLNGTGSTATLQFAGNTAVNGQFSTGAAFFNLSSSVATNATDIEPGGTIKATSSATIAANVEVDGAGAKLIDAGLLTLGGAATNPALYVFNNGFVRAANLTITGYNAEFAPSGDPQVVISGAGTMEIGSAGNAATGALTIDPGARLTNESLTGSIFANVVDNGAIIGADPATSNIYTTNLYVYGTVSGSGTLTIDSGRLVYVIGGVTGLSAVNVGASAGLTIGGDFADAIALSTGASSSLEVADTLSGLTSLVAGASASLVAGTIAIAGSAEIGASASATIYGGFSGAGTLQLDTSSSTTINGALAGFSGVTLQHNVTLTLDGSDTAVPITMAGGADSLIVGAGAPVSATIAGFDATDLITNSDLSFTISGKPITNVVYTATGPGLATLALQDDGQTTNTFNLAGAYTQSQFLVNAIGTADGTSDVGLIDGTANVAAGGAVTGGQLREFLQLSGGSANALSFTGNTLVTGAVTAGSVTFNGGSTGNTIDATDIVAGASVAATGTASLAGHVEVDGAGATLAVTGATILGGQSDNPELLVVNHGVVHFGNTVLEGSNDSGIASRPAIQLDSTATVEVGHAGGAAAGALTVDSGYSLTGAGLNMQVYGSIVDNGLIQSASPMQAGGFVSDLQLSGAVSGVGNIIVGGGTSVDVYGTVTGLGQIMLGASGAFSATDAVSGIGLITTASSGTVTLQSDATGLGSIQLGASSSLTVTGSASGTGAVTLADSASADFVGTISGFSGITVGTHAKLEFGAGDQNVNITLLGSIAGGGSTVEIAPATAMGGLISGFTQGDAIEVNGALATIVTEADYTATGVNLGTLTLKDDGAVVRTLTLAGNYAGQTFLTNNAGQPGYTNVTLAEAPVPCYCRGTLILTQTGERPVEALAIGETVVTASGRLAPVTWVGWRRVDLARHPTRASVQPVRIRAGAFGVGRPQRDLLLSPEHAVFVGGMLIPARHLVGCAGIAVDTELDSTTYYHVELPHHDVLLAEGLPCESWLDTGNRPMFENADGVTMASTNRRAPARAPSAEPCAPLVTGGPALDRVRLQLGAAPVQEVAVLRAGSHSVTVARGVGAVRLNSARGKAAGDARALGVAVTSVRIDSRQIELSNVAFGRGFHPAEADWVWTDGAATLEVGACSEQRTLVIEVAAIAAPDQLAA